MRKIFLIRIFLISIIILFTNYLNANNFKIPPKVDTYQYLKGNVAHFSILHENTTIRIWGWANNGKVAYSIERDIDGRGGLIIEFVILNMISDDTIIGLTIDSFDYGLCEDYDNRLNKLYELLKDRIVNAIKANGIVERRADFLPFPIKRNNEIYDCKINIVKSKEQDEDMLAFGYKFKYDVIMTRNDKSKTIKKSDEIFGTNAFIGGCFISPFEDRALIVIAEEKFVFEGVELFYKFSGSNLKSGFK